MRLYGWYMRTTYEPAGKVRVAGAPDFLSCPSCPSRPSCPALGPPTSALRASVGKPDPPDPLDPPDPSCPLLFVVVGRAGAFFPGTVTVNDAVAREISTPCFCSVRRRSACAPGRESSAGNTYAAGPSVRAFRIERLLFV